MTIGDFVRDALAREYIGETIYSWDKSTKFVVYAITVEDGGVDPQWQITFYSKQAIEMNAESAAWHRANNPTGGNLAPKELDDRWRRGWVEHVAVTLVDHKLPEIIETPEEEEEDNPDLSKCEQCGEKAWDGYICHACGMKEI